VQGYELRESSGKRYAKSLWDGSAHIPSVIVGPSLEECNFWGYFSRLVDTLNFKTVRGLDQARITQILSRLVRNKRQHAINGNATPFGTTDHPMFEMVDRATGSGVFTTPSISWVLTPTNSPGPLNWFVEPVNVGTVSPSTRYDVTIRLQSSFANMNLVDVLGLGNFVVDFGFGEVVANGSSYTILEHWYLDRCVPAKCISWRRTSDDRGTYDFTTTFKGVTLATALGPKPLSFWTKNTGSWNTTGGHPASLGFTFVVTAMPTDVTPVNAVISGGSVSVSGTVDARCQALNGTTWEAIPMESTATKKGLSTYNINPVTDLVPVDVRGWHTGFIDPASAMPVVGGAVGLPIVTSVTTVGSVASVALVTEVLNVSSVSSVGTVGNVSSTLDVNVKSASTNALVPVKVESVKSGLSFDNNNHVWDATATPPQWVKEGTSGTVPHTTAHITGIDIQTSPLWASSVKPSAPSIVQPNLTQDEIGLLGAGASKGDGPFISNPREMVDAHTYNEILVEMGFNPSCVIDGSNYSVYTRFLQILSIKNAASATAPSVAPTPYEPPLVDIGLIGAGSSKGDGPAHSPRRSPSPTIKCSNQFSVLDNDVELEAYTRLTTALREDYAAATNEEAKVLGEYMLSIVAGEPMGMSRIPAHPTDEREKPRRGSQSHSSSSSSEDEAQPRKPRRKKTEEESRTDQASAVRRFISKFHCPSDLLHWLDTHRDLPLKWRREVIDACTSSNKWDGPCMDMLNVLLSNGVGQKSTADCIKLIMKSVFYAEHPDLPSSCAMYKEFTPAERKAVVAYVTKLDVPAPRLVCIEPNPGPAQWVRDLTCEGVEPNPGPVHPDELPDKMDEIRALPSHSSVVEAASRSDPQSGERVDFVAEVALVSGQYGLGNVSMPDASRQMTSINQYVNANNTISQNGVNTKPEIFTWPLTNGVILNNAWAAVTNADPPSMVGVVMQAMETGIRRLVPTELGTNTLLMATAKTGVRPDQVTIYGKMTRDVLSWMTMSATNWGVDIDALLLKLQLYATSISCIQPGHIVPWGDEVGVSDPTSTYTAGGIVTGAWNAPADAVIPNGGYNARSINGAGLPIYPFESQAAYIRPKIFFHTTDQTVPPNSTRYHINNSLANFKSGVEPAAVYALLALAVAKYPVSILQLLVPGTQAGPPAGAIPSRRIPYSNLVMIDGQEGDIHIVGTVRTANRPPTNQNEANDAMQWRPLWGTTDPPGGNRRLNVVWVGQDLADPDAGYDALAYMVSWLRDLTTSGDGPNTLWQFMIGLAREMACLGSIENVVSTAAHLSIRYTDLIAAQVDNDAFLTTNIKGSTPGLANGHRGYQFSDGEYFGCCDFSHVRHVTISMPNPVALCQVLVGAFSCVSDRPMDTIYTPLPHYNIPRLIQSYMFLVRPTAVGWNAVVDYHGLPWGIWSQIFGQTIFRDQMSELREYFIGGIQTSLNSVPRLGHLPQSLGAALTGYAATLDDYGRCFTQRCFAPVYGLLGVVRRMTVALVLQYVQLSNAKPVFLSDYVMAQFVKKYTRTYALYPSYNKRGTGILEQGSRQYVFSNGSISVPISPRDRFTTLGTDSIVTADDDDTWNAGIAMTLYNGSYVTYTSTPVDVATYVVSNEFAVMRRCPPSYTWGPQGTYPGVGVLTGTRRVLPITDSSGNRILIAIPQNLIQTAMTVLSGTSFTSLPAWSIRHVVPQATLLQTSEASNTSRLTRFDRTVDRLNSAATPPVLLPPGGVGPGEQ